jgi:surfeit locus 1 family protein
VPSELRDPARRDGSSPAGEVTVTGIVRAPEQRGWFVPENRPERNEWFVRDVAQMAEARGLDRVAPFWIDADPAPNAAGWPRPGQTNLAIPNNHLGYALTWFGLALTLVAVFGAWGRQRLRSSAPSGLPLPPSPPNVRPVSETSPCSMSRLAAKRRRSASPTRS